MTIDEETIEKLQDEVDENLEKLEVEYEKFQELMDGRSVEDGPRNWEHKELVAERLHRFYSGVEQILKRIANRLDGDTPDGRRWHKELLQQMSSHGEHRPPVVSDELRKRLLQFQGFRHFYRESYLVDLEWEQMTSLIEDFEKIFEMTRDSIEAFMSEIER